MVQIKRPCVWRYLDTASAYQKDVTVHSYDIIMMRLILLFGKLQLLLAIHLVSLFNRLHGFEDILAEVFN